MHPERHLLGHQLDHYWMTSARAAKSNESFSGQQALVPCRQRIVALLVFRLLSESARELVRTTSCGGGLLKISTSIASLLAVSLITQLP